MIRWRYLFTRLLIVAIILALLTLALGPAAGYATARSLEKATGAKVEIDSASVGLFPPKITYRDLQIADPRSDKEMRNAFQAESIELEMDLNELLLRRWVAKSGRISGVQIGGLRTSSGHLEPSPSEDLLNSPSDQGGSSVLGNLIRSTASHVGNEAASMGRNLETVRRSAEIRSRWERDYDTLVVQARELEKQIRDIRDSARGIDNPLRDWEELDRTLAKGTQAREKLLVVRQAIDTLPERFQADLASMDEAKKIDLKNIDRYVPGDISNSDNFGVDLITSAIRDQVKSIRSYVDGGRALANYTVLAPDTGRVRGVNFDLDGHNYQPEMLIRQCSVDGMMRADGEAYVMEGTLENLTPTPELLDMPTRVRLRLEGRDVVRVEYVRDRRDGTDSDLLTLHWPQTKSDGLRLGDDQDANISISGGNRELWVQIRTEGDQLEGRLVSKQTGIQMRLNVDPKYASSPAVNSLGNSLATVDNMNVDAKFTGTWSDMDVSLTTNLGQIFHRAATEAIAGQMQATRAKLAAQVDQAYANETVQLRKWLTTRQAEARTLVASADKSIEEMSKKVIKELGDTDEYLGRLRTAIIGRTKLR